MQYTVLNNTQIIKIWAQIFLFLFFVQAVSARLYTQDGHSHWDATHWFGCIYKQYGCERDRDRFQLISAKEQTKEEMLKCLSQKRNKIKQNTQLC